MSNAQVALQAAALVHQKAAAGSGASTTSSYTTKVGDVKEFKSSGAEVLRTADHFLEWLIKNDELL